MIKCSGNIKLGGCKRRRDEDFFVSQIFSFIPMRQGEIDKQQQLVIHYESPCCTTFDVSDIHI